jgi:hypothetical protein
MIMIRTATLFVILLVSTATLSAQKGALAGVWDVQGQSPKGLSYEGKLDIKAVNAPLYRLTWDIQYEDEEKNQTYPGTAIFNQKEGKMYAAYGINTLRYGLISYPLTEEGGLQGSASWTSHNGGGAELLGGVLDGDIEGTYEVVGRRSKGDVDQGVSETYAGTLIIKKVREHYRLEWYLGDGMPYTGFAYKTDTALIGAWGIDGSYGLETYTIGRDLKRAKGIWVSPDYEMMEGSEMLRKR